MPIWLPPGGSGGSGTPGADGKTVRNGSGAPSAGTGVNGDFYIDTTDWVIYGPKAGGAWPEGVPLLGEDGDPGLDGEDGLSAYEVAVAEGFVGDVTAWLASLVGEKGDKGDKGDQGDPGQNGTNGTDGADGEDGEDGLSAYEVAVAEGFVGDVTAWLASLKGEPGEDGADGEPLPGARIVYLHEDDTYVITGGREFIGEEDPEDDGYTLTDGDEWVDPSG